MLLMPELYFIILLNWWQAKFVNIYNTQNRLVLINTHADTVREQCQKIYIFIISHNIYEFDKMSINKMLSSIVISKLTIFDKKYYSFCNPSTRAIVDKYKSQWPLFVTSLEGFLWLF
jgi:hypothetical protein